MAREATGPGFAAVFGAFGAALQQNSWRTRRRLSSGASIFEHFLGSAGFDRAPWLAVAFGGGIAAWFVLDNRWQWLALIFACLAASLTVLAAFRRNGRYPYLRRAALVLPLLIAAGCSLVWGKSALVGQDPIARPIVVRLAATILEREERTAEQRVRMVLATREPETGRAIRVRVNLDAEADRPGLVKGARISLRARLMPPAPPMLPGAYNFARTAWFKGLAATGSVLGEVEIVSPGDSRRGVERTRARLSRHVRERLPGPSGGIAAALASGDRGAIAEGDARAMRDSGLAHLLAISGLHVSAVVGAAYLIALRLLALSPWLALRWRLPLAASAIGAASGIGYTLLTGAQVPTVRSCIGAVLVLVALALGRQALSLRVLATAAFAVMLLWPESVTGPSFQMSFTAVMAIVALNNAGPARRFLTPREEGIIARGGRYVVALFVTSLVIEVALVPIALYHFHRSGVYGSVANLIAIPMTTVVTMPLIALALLFDSVGQGAPAWWLAGKSIDVMLAIAHLVAAQPGAVSMRPALGLGTMALFVAGGLWLALWQGRVRRWGLIPIGAASIMVAVLEPPDILVSGDGMHVGIASENGQDLLVLRAARSSYAIDNLTEMSAMSGQIRQLADWPGARCNRDFCAIAIKRDDRNWRVLISRSRDRVPERELAAACQLSDIVISDRWLPRSCRPVVLRADRRLMARTGGLSIHLASGRVRTVAQEQGEHGWWQDRGRRAGPAQRSDKTPGAWMQPTPAN